MVRRAGKDYPLELVFVKRSGKRETALSDMPVRITDEDARVVLEGMSRGPYFLAWLPMGRYTVTTRWGTWSSSRVVWVSCERQRLVFAWSENDGRKADSPC